MSEPVLKLLKRQQFALVTLLLASLGALVAQWWWHRTLAPTEPQATFAHITDPRIEASTGSAAAKPNSSAMRSALRALRPRAGQPAPTFLVISGELLAAPERSTGPADSAASPPAPAQTAAPRDTTSGTRDTTSGAGLNAAGQQTPDTTVQPTPDPTPSSPAETAQIDTLAAILAVSPISNVYLAPADSLPLGALNRLRVALAGSGVEVHDLTSCYLRTPSGPCHADVAESSYRLVGFPALRGGAPDTARAISILRNSIGASSAAGRIAVVVAAADPNFAKAPAEPDSAYGTTPAAAWNTLLSSDSVAAVVYGAGLRGVGEEGEVKRTPPLGASGAAQRGMALIDLADRRAVSHTLSYDLATGSIAGVRSRANAAASIRRTRSDWLSRMTDDPRRLSAHTVWWIAFLAAVLTVASLWKIPEPTTAGPAIGGASAPAAAGTAAGTGAQSTSLAAPFLRPTQPGGSVFESNLGRTVLSGLTGIAIVTVLTELWDSSGVNGQALYIVTFIFWFLVLLSISAFVRGFVEACRSVLADQYRPPLVNAVEAASKRRRPLGPTLQVFMDTALNVLLGQNQAESVVWERRYIEHQSALLNATHRVREQVSATVGEALVRAGHAAFEERDFRVSVSLLASDGRHAFYVSSARRSIGKEFDRETVAMVALTSLQARWYKDTYATDAARFISTAALSERAGAPVTPDTLVRDLNVVGSNPLPARVEVIGLHADGVAATLSGELPANSTLRDLLRMLNAPEALGAGHAPAQISLESAGRLTIVHDAPASGTTSTPARAVTAVRLVPTEPGGEGVTLADFTPATMEEVLLFDSASRTAIPGYDVPVKLGNHLGQRGSHDYQAFMVLPFPWIREGTDTNQRRGAIHISFRRAEYMDALWYGLERSTDTVVTPNYAAHRSLLESRMLRDHALRAVLEQSVRVLSELIQQLNDILFKSRFGRRI